nr:sigma-70 family RNA polymerase sigma factor [Brevibacillus fulvus]
MLEEIKRGSITAFEQFYERYVSLVFQIAMRVVEDRMEAEDICHDVFLEVYRKADQFDPARGSVEAWLAVKTRTRSLDRLRKRKNRVLEENAGSEREWQTEPFETEEKAIARLNREALQRAIQNIPSPQREAVYRVYFQSRTHQEVAERMGRPLGTVKSLIRYGLQNVRKQLCQMGWLEQSGGAKKGE